MSISFKHREPIGTGTFPLPTEKQPSKYIFNAIQQSPIKGKVPTIFYIHVPFCKKFCSYCGIFKYPYKKNALDHYVDILTKEISSYFSCFPERELAAVYFGGGTATLMSKDNWEKVFSQLHRFKSVENCEITIEGTPDGFSKDNLLFFRDNGVTRISVGVQSLVGTVNENLSRFYSLENLPKTIDEALTIVGDVNIDLIYNLPGQTRKSFMEDLCNINKLGATHITINPLVILSSAPMSKKIETGLMSRPSEEMEIALFSDALKTLSEMGYEQYTVRDFCKKGKQCQYIIRTAYCFDIIAIGLGAYGYLNGTSYRNTHESIQEYAQAINDSRFSFNLMHNPTEDAFLRRIMVQLFRLTNFSFEKSEDLHQKDLLKVFKNEISSIVESGLINMNDGIVKHTEEGLIYANNIRSLFFDSDVNFLGFGLSGVGESQRGNYQ